MDEYFNVEPNVLVQCGNLDLENVNNCTKVDKGVSNEQKTTKLVKIIDYCKCA